MGEACQPKARVSISRIGISFFKGACAGWAAVILLAATGDVLGLWNVW
jgi:hypothetical protein